MECVLAPLPGPEQLPSSKYQMTWTLDTPGTLPSDKTEPSRHQNRIRRIPMPRASAGVCSNSPKRHAIPSSAVTGCECCATWWNSGNQETVCVERTQFACVFSLRVIQNRLTKGAGRSGSCQRHVLLAKQCVNRLFKIRRLRLWCA